MLSFFGIGYVRLPEDAAISRCECSEDVTIVRIEEYVPTFAWVVWCKEFAAPLVFRDYNSQYRCSGLRKAIGFHHLNAFFQTQGPMPILLYYQTNLRYLLSPLPHMRMMRRPSFRPVCSWIPKERVKECRSW